MEVKIQFPTATLKRTLNIAGTRKTLLLNQRCKDKNICLRLWKPRIYLYSSQ